MNLTNLHSHPLPAAIQTQGQVLILEAVAGQSRDQLLQQWLQDAKEQGAKTWLLPCNFDVDGIWAGLKDIFESILPQIQAHAPHLIEKYSYEITIILPAWRRKITVRNPNLTDTAIESERTRNYPIDRAYRILHGLIDLLDTWYKDYTDGSPLAIACDDYNYSGFLVQRFFRELVRRRGAKLNLSLLLVTETGSGKAISEQFTGNCLAGYLRLNLPTEIKPIIPQAEMTRLAQQLELLVKQDDIETEIHLPQLIQYWLLSDQPQKALIYQAAALGIYNHQGFYEDVLRYCEVVRPQLAFLCGQNHAKRWTLVSNIFNCYIALGQWEEGRNLIETEALAKIDNPCQLITVNYLMAMLHSRFLPEKDFEKASDYLETSLRYLSEIELSPDEKHFQTSFTLNGLAFVRHRQGRAKEAIELCHSASALLNTHLAENQQMLHRSVLVYNAGQVYDSLGDLNQAIDHYTLAMEMDPNYSDYYNDRGNAYLKLGQFEAAIADYLNAIDLSPPYSEVWTNLGMCYGKIGQFPEAVNAFSMALDFSPEEISAWVNRAQAFEMLGELEKAIADYNAALSLNPEQPLLFANRAILYYEGGHLQESLNDLNEAIRLSPENSELYQNRATAHVALQHFEDALRDLQTYLKLNPQAEDRPEIEHQMSHLLAVS